MACSLLSYTDMTVTHIEQLVDGEELVSFELVDVTRAVALDDPRRGALERRGAAELSARRSRSPGARSRWT